MSNEISVFVLMLGAALLSGFFVWLRFQAIEIKLKRNNQESLRVMTALQQERNDVAAKNRQIEMEQNENNRMLIQLSEELAKANINIRHLESNNQTLLHEYRMLENAAFTHQTQIKGEPIIQIGM
jgi:predicted nuclease with TOPRIM domain